MDVSAVKIVEPNVSYSTTKTDDSSKVKKYMEPESSKVNTKNTDDRQGKKELSKDELMNVNSQLNKFMSLINSDIQFEVHERTKQLMVQVVGGKDHTILKEFPSHEMLDVLANISDYVGVLLDKKA